MKLSLVACAFVCALLGFGAIPHARAIVQSPPIPFEDPGACPFEGCTYRDWTARKSLTAHAARRSTAPVAFRVEIGERVSALTGVVVTLTPGRVQFREPTTLRSSSGDVAITPGETLYLLTYQGEGFRKAWFRGRLLTDVDTVQFINGVCEANPSRCLGRVVEKSRTEWWVQIRNRSGKVGWTREPEKFDGKDALGK